MTSLAVGQTAYSLLRFGATFTRESAWKGSLLLPFDCIDTATSVCTFAYRTVTGVEARLRKGLALLGGSLSGTAAFFLIRKVTQAPIAQVNLSDILKAMNGGSITASWTRPSNMVFRFSCVLLAMRIGCNVGQAILGNDVPLSLARSALQALTLFNISKPQWLQITRTYDNPFASIKHVVLQGGNLETFQDTVTQMKASFYLTIDTFDPSDLQNKIKAVYDYSSKLFENSAWSRYWMMPLSKQLYNDRFSLEALNNLSAFHRVLFLKSQPQLMYRVMRNIDCSPPSMISFITAQVHHVSQAVIRPLGLRNFLNWAKEGYPKTMQSLWVNVFICHH